MKLNWLNFRLTTQSTSDALLLCCSIFMRHMNHDCLSGRANRRAPTSKRIDNFRFFCSIWGPFECINVFDLSLTLPAMEMRIFNRQRRFCLRKTRGTQLRRLPNREQFYSFSFQFEIDPNIAEWYKTIIKCWKENCFDVANTTTQLSLFIPGCVSGRFARRLISFRGAQSWNRFELAKRRTSLGTFLRLGLSMTQQKNWRMFSQLRKRRNCFGEIYWRIADNDEIPEMAFDDSEIWLLMAPRFGFFDGLLCQLIAH